MKTDCKTCHYNFPSGEGRVCANHFYGEKVSDILRESRECPSYRISFSLFVRKKNKRK